MVYCECSMKKANFFGSFLKLFIAHILNFGLKNRNEFLFSLLETRFIRHFIYFFFLIHWVVLGITDLFFR